MIFAAQKFFFRFLSFEYFILLMRYDPKRYFNVRSKADTSASLIYRTGPTTKKRKAEKLKKEKTDMLRSIDKQSWESVASVLKKKRKATVGRICRKGRF